MDKLNEANQFFNEYGFCVIKEVIEEKENIKGRNYY